VIRKIRHLAAFSMSPVDGSMMPQWPSAVYGHMQTSQATSNASPNLCLMARMAKTVGLAGLDPADPCWS
jgi:hypothetical protein